MDQIQTLARLLEYCESFAKKRLSDVGEFAPFGAFINSSGKLEALAAMPPKSKQSTEDAYRLLWDSTMQMAKEERLLAYAIASGVTVPLALEPKFPVGIRINVEAKGYSRVLFTPFRSLPYRALRRFFVVVPSVEYGEEISVDAKQYAFGEAS
jgi:hypothetical protein